MFCIHSIPDLNLIHRFQFFECLHAEFDYFEFITNFNNSNSLDVIISIVTSA